MKESYRSETDDPNRNKRDKVGEYMRESGSVSGGKVEQVPPRGRMNKEK